MGAFNEHEEQPVQQHTVLRKRRSRDAEPEPPRPAHPHRTLVRPAAPRPFRAPMTFDSVEPREPVELIGAKGSSSHGEHGDLRARASRRLELICAGEPAPPNDPRGQDAADYLSHSCAICEDFGLSRQTAGLAASYLAHAKARTAPLLTRRSSRLL